MTTIREFHCIDLLRFASVNLDHFVYTDTMAFYLGYLGKWPSYMKIAVAPCNRIIGYVIGEASSATRETKQGTHWRAHVTAVTVASEYRRQKSATALVQIFEENHDGSHNAYYTNVYVRESNTVAIKMFAKLGYLVCRRVLGLYSDNEDAFEMRKFYSKLSEKDGHGGLWLGVYKADDNLNYYSNPLNTWGGQRKAGIVPPLRFQIVDVKELLQYYVSIALFFLDPGDWSKGKAQLIILIIFLSSWLPTSSSFRRLALPSPWKNFDSENPYFVNFYLGYVIYKRMQGYFSEGEDAYDISKSLEDDFQSMRKTSMPCAGINVNQVLSKDQTCIQGEEEEENVELANLLPCKCFSCITQIFKSQ